MKKDKSLKILTILTLCFSILGISFGFAAFSNTLTISSEAVVVPNSNDFKMKVYGIPDWKGSYNESDLSLYTSNDISVPLTTFSKNIATVANITHSGSSIGISNLSLNITDTHDMALYYFVIKNEGEYDSYLKTSLLESYLKGLNGTCTTSDDVSAELYNKACEQIKIIFNISSSGSGSNKITSTEDYKIAKGDYVIAEMLIGYDLHISSSEIVRADGNFSVTFPNIELEFTSAPPSDRVN